MSKLYSDVAVRKMLEKRISDLNMNYTEYAQSIGVTVQFVSRVLSGAKNPCGAILDDLKLKKAPPAPPMFLQVSD